MQWRYLKIIPSDIQKVKEKISYLRKEKLNIRIRTGNVVLNKLFQYYQSPYYNIEDGQTNVSEIKLLVQIVTTVHCFSK